MSVTNGVVTQSPNSATPSCVSAVSPVQWMHSFAYTPGSARVENSHHHSELVAEDRDEDALPTQFHSRNGCSEDGLSATRASSTQRRMKKTRLLSGGSEGPSCVSDTPSRPRSRRIVLDAVEIVRRKKVRGPTGDSRTAHAGCPTDRACNTPSSYYPSPPASSGPRDVQVAGPSTHIVHPITETQEERVSPEATLPLTTSKYFVRASAGQADSVSGNFVVLTPPSSPVLTIPVYIESSDFEHPLLDSSSNEPLECTLDESRRTWYDNPELFDDLMIMLRRLKPILVQETVRDDPWKVLIAVRLLNVTSGKAAIPVFCKIMSRWPTPQDLMQASQDELVELLRPLGLYNKRARWLKEISERFLEDQAKWSCSRMSLLDDYTISGVPHLQYPGVGPYALDSLRIFCSGDVDAWKHVMPRDKELVRYLRWRWAVEEGKVWYPDEMGVIGDVDVPYLITLVDELAAH
ncbi:DNA glycosylase [Boletus reticuloceps]|uniref:DNA glycosylase n=1 Tax=Boletus reticuloceps TaxID=495285 RepID=A0A8I2YLA1_9AGAM|nr:DNA glycosylase [Boletus reticuloceps]